MKFSVIIPVYNAEKTIEKTLQSLLNQTFQDYEAIIIDDGSRDRSGEIIRDMIKGNEKFHYYRQDNSGVSAARNKGITLASGDFLLFLDSDDQFSRDYMDIMNGAITSYPEYDHYWCGYSILSGSGKARGKRIWNKGPGEISVLDRSQIMSLHKRELAAPLWNKVFRRDKVLQFRIFMDEGLSLGEDLLFNFKYLDIARTEIIMICKPLYCYTNAEDGSLDSKYRENLEEIFERIDEEIRAYLIRWNVDDSQLEIFNRSVFWHYDQVLHNTFRKNNDKSLKEKLDYNHTIMKSRRFQSALQNAASGIHPLYHFAYQKKIWSMVMILDFIAEIKQKVLGR